MGIYAHAGSLHRESVSVYIPLPWSETARCKGLNQTIKNSKIMKRTKEATIVALAALAAQTAIADMKKEFGKDFIPMDATVINYTYDPFDGMYA